MLNFIYWPISAVLWFWHWLLSLVMDPSWGITWILAIVLLTWTLKALMVKPTISQIRSSRKMQEIQPKVQEIRAKYGNDQTKAAQEMQKVYKESGVRPMAGCLPVFVQIPMFVGLFHVLRSFDRTVAVAGGIGHPSGDPMSVEDNANTANYIFKPELVQQFLDAKIFDVPLVTNLRLNSPIVEGVTTSQAAVIIVPMIAVNFGSFLEPRSAEVSDSIMAVADKHAEQVNSPALSKPYNSLRAKASKFLTPAVPDFGRVLQKHM